MTMTKQNNIQSRSFSNRITFSTLKKIDQHAHYCRLKRKYARGLFYVSHAVAAAAAAIVLGQRSHHTGTKAGAGIVVQGTSYTIALIS